MELNLVPLIEAAKGLTTQGSTVIVACLIAACYLARLRLIFSREERAFWREATPEQIQARAATTATLPKPVKAPPSPLGPAAMLLVFLGCALTPETGPAPSILQAHRATLAAPSYEWPPAAPAGELARAGTGDAVKPTPPGPARKDCDTYATFVQELKKCALHWARHMKDHISLVEAEEGAVNVVGHGLAQVPMAEATQNPDQVALEFAKRHTTSGEMPLYDQDAQWALCPLTQREAFLQLVDVGALVRDELRSQGQGDKIRQDAARVIEALDLEDPPDALPHQKNAPNPHSAAIAFLRAWPDLSHFSAPAWLTKAARRKMN